MEIMGFSSLSLELTLEVMEITGYSTLLRSPEQESYHKKFSVLHRPPFLLVGSHPSAGNTVRVFLSY